MVWILPDVVLLQPVDLSLVFLLLFEVVPLKFVKLCHQLLPLLSNFKKIGKSSAAPLLSKKKIGKSSAVLSAV